MLKLFHSLFGGGRANPAAGIPEALLDEAIERAVAGTDPRIRMLANYRRQLREPVIAAIRHVVAVVDALPAPLAADADTYRADPCLRAMFASLERLYEVLGKDPGVDAARRAAPAAPFLHGLLAVRPSERRVLGLDLENDLLKRDVAQTVVSFDGHRVIDVQAEEEGVRRALKRRAFDHLLAQVLESITERSESRAGLASERKLLRHKLEALKGAGWSFGEDGGGGDVAKLESELAGIERELEALGPDTATLQVHCELLARALAEPAAMLDIESRALCLDQRNVLREAGDPAAVELPLRQLRDGRGARLAVLLLRIDPERVPRTDFFKAASRYL